MRSFASKAIANKTDDETFIPIPQLNTVHSGVKLTMPPDCIQ